MLTLSTESAPGCLSERELVRELLTSFDATFVEEAAPRRRHAGRSGRGGLEQPRAQLALDLA